jgi:uncharacterized protein (TIGR03066 family)
MRLFFGCTLFVVASFASADEKVEKIDTAKLVGKWKAEAKDGSKIEFTKDGKIRVKLENGVDGEGSYTIDGNKMNIKLKYGDQEITEVFTVTKLTDEDLVVTVGEKKKVESYKRIKDK